MHLVELERSLRQRRLGGMAAVLETRLRQAQAQPMSPIDLSRLNSRGLQSGRKIVYVAAKPGQALRISPLALELTEYYRILVISKLEGCKRC
jgi:hypothetical protein